MDRVTARRLAHRRARVPSCRFGREPTFYNVLLDCSWNFRGRAADERRGSRRNRAACPTAGPRGAAPSHPCYAAARAVGQPPCTARRA